MSPVVARRGSSARSGGSGRRRSRPRPRPRPAVRPTAAGRPPSSPVGAVCEHAVGGVGPAAVEERVCTGRRGRPPPAGRRTRVDVGLGVATNRVPIAAPAAPARGPPARRRRRRSRRRRSPAGRPPRTSRRQAAQAGRALYVAAGLDALGDDRVASRLGGGHRSAAEPTCDQHHAAGGVRAGDEIGRTPHENDTSATPSSAHSSSRSAWSKASTRFTQNGRSVSRGSPGSARAGRRAGSTMPPDSRSRRRPRRPRQLRARGRADRRLHDRHVPGSCTVVVTARS